MSPATHLPIGTGPDGASLAATLAAGIGAFAMGFFVIIHEAGIYSAPSLHAGAGGLSGRSTFAVITWLAAWAILHRRWRAGSPEPTTVLWWTVALALAGVVLCFPPVWGVFG